jgi:hypothetical protein
MLNEQQIHTPLVPVLGSRVPQWAIALSAFPAASFPNQVTFPATLLPIFQPTVDQHIDSMGRWCYTIMDTFGNRTMLQTQSSCNGHKSSAIRTSAEGIRECIQVGNVPILTMRVSNVSHFGKIIISDDDDNKIDNV